MSANPETNVPTRTRWREFWRRNNVLFVMLPLLLIFAVLSYAVLQALDPRIGVEGFGDLFGYLINGVRAALIIFTAFWMKKWLWFDLHAKTELRLFEAMEGRSDGDPLLAHWIVIRDRVEWIAALVLATWWYTR